MSLIYIKLLVLQKLQKKVNNQYLLHVSHPSFRKSFMSIILLTLTSTLLNQDYYSLSLVRKLKLQESNLTSHNGSNKVGVCLSPDQKRIQLY